MTLTRRAFLARVGGGLGAAALTARALVSQAPVPAAPAAAMDENAYRPVRLPARPGAAPSTTDDRRDALERTLHCQCGCGLSVFTCRTTDFTCSISPAMHADVMSLVAGGYGPAEIVAAFQRVYGERVLMAPVKAGFNWVGYLLPFVALGGGAAVVTALLRRWTLRRVAVAASGGGRVAASSVSATPDELARLDALVRSDS